jgi:lactoylglutathione lyase
VARQPLAADGGWRDATDPNEQPMNSMTSSSKLKFGGIAICVDDVRVVLEFYRRAFGFETRFFDAEYEYGELDTGGAHLGIASHKLGHFLMPGRYTPAMNTRESFALEIGLVTDDVTGAFARAVSEGAQAVAEPTEMPWGGTVAYVRSIEGTLIVLCTPTAS